MARRRARGASCVALSFVLALAAAPRCAADASKEPKSVSVTLRTRWEVRRPRSQERSRCSAGRLTRVPAAPAPRSPRRSRMRRPRSWRRSPRPPSGPSLTRGEVRACPPRAAAAFRCAAPPPRSPAAGSRSPGVSTQRPRAPQLCEFTRSARAHAAVTSPSGDDAAVASGDTLACEQLILDRAGAGMSGTMRRVRAFHARLRATLLQWLTLPWRRCFVWRWRRGR